MQRFLRCSRMMHNPFRPGGISECSARAILCTRSLPASCELAEGIVKHTHSQKQSFETWSK